MDKPPPSLIVRRTKVADAEAFARIFCDEAVFGGVLQMPHPSADMWRKRLEDNDAPGKIGLPLTAEVEGEVIGNAGLHPATLGSQRRAHVMALGISVATAWQGQGVGSALMAAMIDYADRWANVQRIELTVYTDNAAAVALYRKFGFETEGTLRAYAIRGGRYVDAFYMARLHPYPPQLR